MHFSLVKLGHSGLDVLLIDGDTVSPFNIGRQSFWSHDCNEYKSKVLIDRYNSFGGTQWSYQTSFSTPELLSSIINKYDLILTCVDNAQFRVDLAQYFESHSNNVLWGDCGNSSHQSQTVLGHLCSNPKSGIKYPNVYDLYPSLASLVSIEKPEDSCSHEQALSKQDLCINQKVASSMVNILWQLIRHGECSHNGTIIDLKEGTEDPIKADPNVWASFGYIKDNKAHQ